MDEDGGLTPIEFGPQGLELGDAQMTALGVGHQHHTVGIQGVECAGGLRQGRVDVGQRDAGEVAEAGGLDVSAPYSFTARARVRASASPSRWTPGEVTDSKK